MEYQIETITTMGGLPLPAIKIGKVCIAYNQLTQEILGSDFMVALIQAVESETNQERLTSKAAIFQHVTLLLSVNNQKLEISLYVSRNFAGLIYALLQTAPVLQTA